MQKDVGKFGISDKRGRIRTSVDPYLPPGGLKEPALCGSCQAFYRHKRWELNPEAVKVAKAAGEVSEVTCPACQKIAEGYPEGIVTLRGDYLWAHEAEIRNLLANEEQKARAKNPLERIMRMTREADHLTIETTEKKLAEHLGRAMHKAHHGDLKVSRSDDQAACRVEWERPY